MGRVRHLELKHLWVQDQVRADDLRVDWIPRKENPAGVLTHPTTKSELQRTLEWLPERFARRATHPRHHFVRSEGVVVVVCGGGGCCGCGCVRVGVVLVSRRRSNFLFGRKMSVQLTKEKA